jgi:hypothetical protein
VDFAVKIIEHSGHSDRYVAESRVNGFDLDIVFPGVVNVLAAAKACHRVCHVITSNADIDKKEPPHRDYPSASARNLLYIIIKKMSIKLFLRIPQTPIFIAFADLKKFLSPQKTYMIFTGQKPT